MYDVLDVCRFIINYSNEKDYGVSNLKLQKLLYFVQALFLIDPANNEPCFLEDIQAWDFGPVVPKAYHKYKEFASGDIPSFIENSAFEDIEDIIAFEDIERIVAVVDKYKDYSATDLVSITHYQSPWSKVYTRGKNKKITIESMREYFGN